MGRGEATRGRGKGPGTEGGQGGDQQKQQNFSHDIVKGGYR